MIRRKECPKCETEAASHRRLCEKCGFEFYARNRTVRATRQSPVNGHLPVSHKTVISDLLDEINDLQNSVLYLEASILKKRLAIEEILKSRLCRLERAVEEQTPA